MFFNFFSRVHLAISNFLLIIICGVGIQALGRKSSTSAAKKLKWFAYCHFGVNSSTFRIEHVKCDKCYTFLNDLDNVVITGDFYSQNIPIEKYSAHKEANTEYDDYTGGDMARKGRFLDDDICSFYENEPKYNRHFHWINSEQEEDEDEPALIPVLTEQWFDADLLRLIEKNQVLTNLNSEDLNLIHNLPPNLISIELTNFGIEQIGHNAFNRFSRLKKLKMSYNNFHSLDMSHLFAPAMGFSPSVPPTEKELEQYGSSDLEELDCSYNKLASINLENSVYLNKLKVLNLSNNLLKTFDLHFTSIVMPNLKRLDLSFNLLKKLPILNNYVHISDNSNVKIEPHGLTSSPSFAPSQSTFQREEKLFFELMSDKVLPDMASLNLNGNNLNNFADLFSISAAFLEDNRFCGSNVNSSAKIDASKSKSTSSFKLNVNNNRWKCDCKSFEVISAIKSSIGEKNALNSDQKENDLFIYSSEKFARSCYLTTLVSQNTEVFEAFFDMLNMRTLKCSYLNANEMSDKTNWPFWYYQNCVNQTDKESIKNIAELFIQNTTMFVSTSKLNSRKPTSTTKLAASQTIVLNNINNNHVRPSQSINQTQQNTVLQSTRLSNTSTRQTTNLKYDTSVLLIWTIPLGLLVLGLACGLVILFYCRRKCQIYKQQARRRRSMRNMRSIRHLSRMATMQENRHFLVASGDENRGALVSDASSIHSTSIYSPVINTISNDSNQRIDRNNVNSSGIYFYMPTSNSEPASGSATIQRMSAGTFGAGIFRNSVNSANGEEDDPPDYYDVVAVKNTVVLANGALKRTKLKDTVQAGATRHCDERHGSNRNETIDRFAGISAPQNEESTSMERTIINVVGSSNAYRNSVGFANLRQHQPLNRASLQSSNNRVIISHRPQELVVSDFMSNSSNDNNRSSISHDTPIQTIV
jgi:hypothetical protein